MSNNIIQQELLDCIKTNNLARFHELIGFWNPLTCNTILLEEAIRSGNRYFAEVFASKMKYNTLVDWKKLSGIAHGTGNPHIINLITAHGGV